MKHHSPISQYTQDQSSRRYNAQMQQPIPREQRATSVSAMSVSKLVKVTVHPARESNLKQFIRPIERRTVQLYDKPQLPTQILEYISNERQDNTYGEITQSQTYVVQRDTQIDLLNQENQRLMSTVQEMHGQVESWKMNYGNLHQEFQCRKITDQEIESYRQKLNENCSEVQLLRYELNIQKNLNTKVESELLLKMDKQRVQIEIKDEKLALLSTEFERVTAQQKKTLLEQNLIDEKELKSLETQIKVRDDILEDKNQEIGQLRRQVLKLVEVEKLNALSKIENERLYKLIDMNEADIRDQNNVISRQDGALSNLKIEVQRLNQQVLQKHDELANLSQENQEFSQSLKERDDQNQELTTNSDQLTQQLNELSQSLNSKTDFVRTQKEEINLLKPRISELLQQIQFYQIDMDELVNRRQFLSEQLSNKNKELSQLTLTLNDFNILTVQLDGDLNASKTVCEEYTIKIQFLSVEIENLNQKLKQKQKELEDMRQTIYEQELLVQSKDNELKIMIEKVKFQMQEITRLSNFEQDCGKFQQQCDLLCTEVDRLMTLNQQKDSRINNNQQMIKELESSADQMESQYRRLHAELVEEQKMSGETKIKYFEIEGKLSIKIQDFEQLLSENEYEKKKNVTLIDEYRTQLQSVLNEKKEQLNQNQELKESMYNLEGNFDTIQIENQRLNFVLTESTKRNYEQQQNLREQENQTNQIVLDHENRIDEIASENENNLNQNVLQYEKELNSVVQEHESKLSTLVQDHESKLNTVVQDHENELNTVVQDHENKLNEVVNKLNTTVQAHENIINSLVQENQLTLNQVAQVHVDKLNSVVQEQQNLLKAFNKEHQQTLNSMILDHENKLNSVVQDNDEKLAQQALTHEEQLNKTVQDYENQMDSVVQGHENQINSVVTDHENKIDSVASENQNKLISMATENENKISLMTSKNQNQVDQLVSANARLAEELKNLKQENKYQQIEFTEQSILLADHIGQLTTNLESRDETFKALDQSYQQSIQDGNVLEIKLDESNKSYQVLEQALYDQHESNSYLEEEIVSWKSKFIALNRDFHRTQEELMMTQAEHDSLKQRKFTQSIKEVGPTDVKKSIITSNKENLRRAQDPLSDLN